MINEKVRLAFMETMDESDFYRPHDCLAEAFAGPFTDEQIRKLLLMIPDHTFGKGIQWTFGDTEVGDDIYTFILLNNERIKTELKID
jgi:hypothetical protein